MSEGHIQGAGVAQRTAEVGVAIATALFGLIVVVGSLQVGVGWGAEGPKSGFFPFYLGLFIIAASAVNLVHAAAVRPDKSFAEWSQLRQVLAVVIPTAIYVAVIPWTGIYVSSLLLIAVFMIWLGKYRVHVAAGLSVAIVVATYLVFETWFLVPLPKGPLEELLGL
jgi:hypothetical protein